MPFATSLMVPSPPAAMTASKPLQSRVSSIAWPAWAVGASHTAAISSMPYTGQVRFLEMVSASSGRNCSTSAPITAPAIERTPPITAPTSSWIEKKKP